LHPGIVLPLAAKYDTLQQGDHMGAVTFQKPNVCFVLLGNAWHVCGVSGIAGHHSG
jgi:hypothetical protein